MNIVTVVNSQYMPFAEIFFKSLVKLSDYKRINKVYIIDTGLGKPDVKLLSSICDKIVLCDTKTFLPFADMHTADWRKIVSMKLSSVSRLTKIMDNIFPLCIIDIDSYFNSNFIDVVDIKSDVSVCKRDQPTVNQDNYVLTHIGSFFSVNTAKALRFLDRWMKEMEVLEGDHIETPALCNVLRVPENEGDLNIQHIDQNIISAINYTDECKIFHLKSDGPGSGSTISYRINKLNNHVNVDTI